MVANDTISESAPTESISNTDESPVIVNESQPVSAPLPNNLSVETDSSESTGVTIKKEFKFTPVDKIARSLHDSSVVLEYIMDNTSISDQESFNKVINVISNRLSRSYTDINHFCEWASEEEIDTFVNYANKM